MLEFHTSITGKCPNLLDNSRKIVYDLINQDFWSCFMRSNKKVMTSQEFADYINLRTITSVILTAAEVARYRRTYYRPSELLTTTFAEEIIQKWNGINLEEDGDPYGIIS